MRPLLSALFVPADPVVAIHDSTEAAEASIQYLGRAGYESRMLGVVASRERARPAPAAGDRGPVARWGASGVVWGLLWVAFALAGAALLASAALSIGAILMTGALLLAAQTAIVSARLAPEPLTRAAWHAPAGHPARQASELAGDSVLLLVNGSRSEIALARTLLHMRSGAAVGA